MRTRLPNRLQCSSTFSVPWIFVTSVCTGCSTISRTPTAAARWKTTSHRCTSSLTTDDLSTESTIRWKSRRSRRCATFRSEPVERSSSAKTSQPSPSRSSARCEPMKPAPPVMSALRPSAIERDRSRVSLSNRQQPRRGGMRRNEYLLVMHRLGSRSLLLVVATLTAAGAAAAAGYALTAPKHYKATAQILVTPVSERETALTGIDLLRDNGGGKRTAAASAAALIKSPIVADAVRAL